MKREEILAWYEDIEERSALRKTIAKPFRFGSIGPSGDVSVPTYLGYDEADARSWVAEASSALAEVFREGHPLRNAWDQILLSASTHDIEKHFQSLVGVFRGAARQVKAGRLDALI